MDGRIAVFADACPDPVIAGPCAGLLRQVCAGPVTVAQIDQSLNGRVVTGSGDSHHVNGPAALDHLYRFRALSDGVLMGVGTAIADDPRLNLASARPG